MDDALLDAVLERLDAVPLTEGSAELLLAACEGEADLEAVLGGQPGPAAAGKQVSGERSQPAGAYLRSVKVHGFRGIGPDSTLTVEPGPGLTVVVGRNGSGKSSFAEGLEVLLTGDLKRWEDLSAVWREGWRNLHAPEPAELSAEFLLEDAGPTVVRRAWPSGAAFEGSSATVQVAGQKQTGIDRLGWRDALVTYRPFLSHTELEAFLGKPSQLYDLLSSVLGLDDLTATEQRLTTARRGRETGTAEVRKSLPALLDRLLPVDDERAEACHRALSGRTRDVERAREIATAARPAAADTQLSRLRQLGQITIAAQDEIQDHVTALRQAAALLTRSAGSRASQAQALVALLSAALGHYRQHGPGDCPVCHSAGALDEQWQQATEEALTHLTLQAAEAEQATAQANDARVKARALFLAAPAALAGAPIATADPVPVQAAWQSWLQLPDDQGTTGLVALAAHIENAFGPLSTSVNALTTSAATELQVREDRWAPVASDVAAWCSRAAAAEVAARPIAALKAAVAWLQGTADDVRNARLAPLADQARKIWSMLRQESNVDLGGIRLSGSSTRRKADVEVTVDGALSAALGVMSQGEVNALALSVFLPRATVAASPFRFLIIDDPVQAMDPAKVDGLAKVLEDASRTRQVLVFTHDDRLPEAIRRLDVAARILEVTRRPGSIVEVRPGLTPAERQLQDAEALCADTVLPREVAARVIPGLCRLAVEATFIEAIRRGQLRKGHRHAEVESDIDAATTLTKKAALAMFEDTARGGEVLPRLNSWDRAAADAFQAVNKGAHEAYRGPLDVLVTQARKLTSTIRGHLS